MRHISASDLKAVLRRGKSVEQFLGRSPLDQECIRYIELRPSQEMIEVWVFDVEDIGTEDNLDLYDFPERDSAGSSEALFRVNSVDVAIEYAQRNLATYPDRWTNLGIVQSEYSDYIREGRPAKWPVA